VFQRFHVPTSPATIFMTIYFAHQEYFEKLDKNAVKRFHAYLNNPFNASFAFFVTSSVCFFFS
jgi:hypothetical protein